VRDWHPNVIVAFIEKVLYHAVVQAYRVRGCTRVFLEAVTNSVTNSVTAFWYNNGQKGAVFAEHGRVMPVYAVGVRIM
jgi:DUF1680 family protein